MRRKKHKHTRRALRFYRITHGFRPPYKASNWGGGDCGAVQAGRAGGRPKPAMLPAAALLPMLLANCCAVFTTLLQSPACHVDYTWR